MKNFIALLLFIALITLTGCVSSTLSSIRKKLPAFTADEFKATLSVSGGGGGSISGSNVSSDGKGNLSADDYHEAVNTPFAGWQLDAKGATVGKTIVKKPATPPLVAK